MVVVKGGLVEVLFSPGPEAAGGGLVEKEGGFVVAMSGGFVEMGD